MLSANLDPIGVECAGSTNVGKHALVFLLISSWTASISSIRSTTWTICFFGALFGIALLRQIEAIYSVPLGQRKYAINNQLANTSDVPFAHLVGRLSDLTRMDDSSCSLTP